MTKEAHLDRLTLHTPEQDAAEDPSVQQVLRHNPGALASFLSTC